MKLNLGTKIRELRRQNGRTQDNLAEALGVTAQAVSRWESGGSYPDMEMIPAIANYFHISIDELFGYHDDREEKIRSILESAAETLNKQGLTVYRGSLTEDVEECINMLKAAAEEFPSEPKILLKLAQALYIWGYSQCGTKERLSELSGIIEDDIDYNSKNSYWKEAIQAYEKVLKLNPSSEERENAIRQIIPLYCKMGEYEKAKSLANDQNAVFISKELLLPLATMGEEKARYQSERIMVLLSNLFFAIYESTALRPDISSSEYGKSIILSLISLYETVFIDGRCGVFHFEIARMYLTLVRYEAHNSVKTEKVLEYFDKGFEHYKAYERILIDGEYKYSAPLVANLNGLTEKDMIPFGNENFWEKELALYPQNICVELRKNCKYAECFE